MQQPLSGMHMPPLMKHSLSAVGCAPSDFLPPTRQLRLRQVYFKDTLHQDGTCLLADGGYHGGGDSSGLDANYPPPPTKRWPEAPWGGGGSLEGGVLGGALGGGGVPGVSVGGGGSRWGDVGGGGGAGTRPPRPSVGQSQAPLTSPCPPSKHAITQNLTLTFGASWFGRASHVDSAEQDPPNFIHSCFCHIMALQFEPHH